MEEKELKKIISILNEKYPQPTTALNFTTPFELLVATILSAQTTDKQVNKVTASLFKKYNKPEDFARLNREELAKEINSLGLYRNKSKYLIEASRKLIKEFDGQLPQNRKDLLKLPGVGRKTANVVLACAFEKDTIPVDTHVFRVANRIGLVKSDNVQEVEEQLMEIIPKDRWSDMHHWLIFHGREVCKARNPKCQECSLNQFCQYYQLKELDN